MGGLSGVNRAFLKQIEAIYHEMFAVKKQA